jgi:hypothetical protein
MISGSPRTLREEDALAWRGERDHVDAIKARALRERVDLVLDRDERLRPLGHRVPSFAERRIVDRCQPDPQLGVELLERGAPFGHRRKTRAGLESRP